MRKHMSIKVLGATAFVATSLAAGASASAAPTDDTTVTFTVTGGFLDILGPDTSDIGSGAPGTDISGAMGSVTVTDGRALLTSAWTATVTSTDFLTGGGTAAETIASTDVTYLSGDSTATTGLGTFTPGQAAGGTPAAFGGSVPAFAESAGVGNNSATWNPTLTVSVPAAGVAGVYTGTVTHSVA